MEKLLKIIRSRFFITAFIIILEFIQLLIVFILLTKYSVTITILGYIFYVGVFLYIINKYKSPEHKLPWIINIMLFFVVGAYIYIILSSNEENKKTSIMYKKNKEKLKLYLNQDSTIEELKSKNMDAFLQANYIRKTTDLPCYKNTKVTYYKIGEDFRIDLLNELKNAKKYIFMEYFTIEEGKMWNPIYEILKEKSNNGVNVYIIYDDFGCMSTLDEKYYQKLNKEGINCIPSNKFKPVLSRIHNNRDHRKITVIDGIVDFTGGINLVDEYINAKEKYGHWKDTAIKLEGKAVKKLIVLFLEMWNTQNKKRLDCQKFITNEYKKESCEGIIAPYGDGPVDFYKDDVGKYVYLNMLNSSKKYVYITTPYLICDYEIINSLCICAKKGG